MCTRNFYGDVSPESILMVTEKAGQEIAKIFREEKGITEITCRIYLTAGNPMKYEIGFDTIESLKTLN